MERVLIDIALFTVGATIGYLVGSQIIDKEQTGTIKTIEPAKPAKPVETIEPAKPAKPAKKKKVVLTPSVA